MSETKCVGDDFGQQHPLSFYIIVWHQHSKDVTNISEWLPTLIQQYNCHQHLASKREQGDGKDALR